MHSGKTLKSSIVPLKTAKIEFQRSRPQRPGATNLHETAVNLKNVFGYINVAGSFMLFGVVLLLVP